MSIIVGLSLAIACAAFAIGLLVGVTQRKSNSSNSAIIEPPLEWTSTLEAMKETDKLGRLIGDAVFKKIAETTKLTNMHGTPHIDECEVEVLCDIVLDHALAVIGQHKGLEAPQ